MASAREIKSAMLSAKSGVQEVLRALYFYGSDYIILKTGRLEKLVHKEQMISLMELGRENAIVDEMSAMTLPEPVSAKTRLEDVPPDTALLIFARKGEGPAGSLSMTSFGEYREQKIREAETVYPEWWGAPIALLYMDDERVALNDAAGAKIPCDVKGLAAQAEKMKRDGIIAVNDKKRELTFSLHPLEENVYLIEDISGDFEMAEELVWWAAVGKAFVRRLEENGAAVLRVSPLETPPTSAAEVLPCFWENEPLGSVAICMPRDADWDDAPASGAPPEQTEGETVSSNDKSGTEPDRREDWDMPRASSDDNDAAEPDAPSKPEPPETEPPARAEDSETAPASEKTPLGKRARAARTRPAKKGKHERSALWKPKGDLDIDLNAISEPSKQKDESLPGQPETLIPSVLYESFGPFGKPAAKRGKAAGRGVADHDGGGESAVSERADDAAEAGENVKVEEAAEKTAAPKLLDKNAARRAYGGPRRKKAPSGGENA